MNYWLFKSEPGEFGIDHLANSPGKTNHWDGVRNYQARNMMRDQMKKGDLAFFYHSNCEQPGIVGTVIVVAEGYSDHTAFDPKDKHFDAKSDPENPRWFMVDVKLKRKFATELPLKFLKQFQGKELQGFQLLMRGNRLSVMPVKKAHWNFINSLLPKSF